MVITLRVFIGFLLQILPCAFYCFYPFLNKLRFSRRNTVLIVLTVILIMASYGVYVCDPNSPIAQSTSEEAYLILDIIFFITLILLLVLYLKIVDENIYKKLFIFFIIANYGFLLEESIRIMDTFVQPATGVIYPDNFIVFYIVAHAVLLIPMLWLLNRIKALFNNRFNDDIWKKVYLVPLFFILTLILIYDLPYIIGMPFVIYQAIVILPITVFIFGILVLMFRVIKFNQIRTEQQARLEMLVHDYQVKINNINQLKEIRHEIKHTITALNILINNENIEEAKNYLDRYLKEFDNVVIEEYSENALLDALLNDYKKKAKDNNIDLKYEIDLKPKFEMDDMDLVEFVTNMLDNALEACLSDKKEDKSIKFTMRQNANFVLFDCKNTFEPKNLNKENNRIISSKKDKNSNHGYGIRIMKSIAGKYNGILRIKSDDEYFSVSSNLCLK